jgi:LysM repeat protein
MLNRFLILLLFSFITASSFSQEQTAVRQYINTYKDIAISEMIRTGVPASIKLAQGILETEAGRSTLVIRSNNHFGIKCKSAWTGDHVFHDDDARGECFRKYNKSEDSYRDHSDFLKNSQRYAALFQLDPMDFEGWARGLKKAGYATNPKYPQLLIKLIYEYNLQDYTLIALGKLKDEGAWLAKNNQPVDEIKIITAPSQELAPVQIQYPSGVFRINDTRVIFIKKGTSFLSIARNQEIPLAKLFEFNDMKQCEEVEKDMLLYLQRKRKTGANEFHIVLQGETLFSISQVEAIRIESLLEYNLLKSDMQPAVGEKLFLHKKVFAQPRLARSEPANQGSFVVADAASNGYASKSDIVFHIVQPKETLYMIANKYEVGLTDVAAWNQMQTYEIKTGQQLKIYKKGNNAIY